MISHPTEKEQCKLFLPMIEPNEFSSLFFLKRPLFVRVHVLADLRVLKVAMVQALCTGRPVPASLLNAESTLPPHRHHDRVLNQQRC